MAITSGDVRSSVNPNRSVHNFTLPMISDSDFAGMKYDPRYRDQIIFQINSCLTTYPSLKFSRAVVPRLRILIHLIGPLPFLIGDVLYAVNIVVMLTEPFPLSIPSMRITDPLIIPPLCKFAKQGGAVDLQPFFNWGPDRSLIELLDFFALCLSQSGVWLVPQLKAADVLRRRPSVVPGIMEIAQRMVNEVGANGAIEKMCRYGLLGAALELSEDRLQQLAARNEWERGNMPSGEVGMVDIRPEIVREARIAAAQEAWEKTASEMRGMLQTGEIDVDSVLKVVRKAAVGHFTTQVRPYL
jgi:hypothetical protein